MTRKELTIYLQGAVAHTSTELFNAYKELTLEKYLEAEKLFGERAMPGVKKFITEHPADSDFALDEYLKYQGNLRDVYKP